MPAAWAEHDLHQEAWKRRTSTFFPMSERESKGSPPAMSGTRMAGAAGAGLAGEGATRRAATARAARKRVTAHSIDDERTDARNWPADRVLPPRAGQD